MRSLLDMPVQEVVWAAVDFESAGAAPGRTDEPVQVGMAVWSGREGELRDLFRSYIHSDLCITRAAQDVHGIRDNDIADAPQMLALWREFKSRLAGAVVVAHGSGTEKRFLRAFPMHGFGPWLDTLTLSRALFPSLSEHSLASVIGRTGLEAEVRELCPGLDWHDALFDAVASLVFLKSIVTSLASQDVRVGQLMNFDPTEYRQYRSILDAAKYLGSGGREGAE